MSIKVLITGKDGLLGSDAIKVFSQLSYEVIPCGRNDFDITDEASTREFIAAKKPDAIVHLAATHEIDYCELNPEVAYKVNLAGTRNIILGAEDVHCRVSVK